MERRIKGYKRRLMTGCRQGEPSVTTKGQHKGDSSDAMGFHGDQPSLGMILRHIRAKSCLATCAVPVPGQGTSPLIRQRESHATSDVAKAPRS